MLFGHAGLFRRRIIYDNAELIIYQSRRDNQMADKPERRELKFNSLDEVVAEVERLAASEVRTTGNHSFPEIVRHLALTHDMVTGKVQGPAPPWYMKLMIGLMKSQLLKEKPLSPGFNLPPAAEAFFWPTSEVSLQDAVAHLKASVANYKANGPLPKHPIFGKVSAEKNLSMNCRHAAMHLSFAHPGEPAA